MTGLGRRLDGKVAFVTGARTGIGQAIALRLAEEGAAVVCVSRDSPQAVADEIVRSGGRALAVSCDVTVQENLDEAVGMAISAWQRVDVCVANAGIPGTGTVETVSPEHWARVLDVNLTGVWRTMRAVLPIMVKQGVGSIITQASASALVGFENGAAYAAAKGGVLALTRQAAIDYGPAGIRVNAIVPGVVHTALLDETIALRGGAGRGRWAKSGSGTRRNRPA